MKVTKMTVTARTTVNVGNYSNVQAERSMEIEIGPGDDVDTIVEQSRNLLAVTVKADAQKYWDEIFKKGFNND